MSFTIKSWGILQGLRIRIWTRVSFSRRQIQLSSREWNRDPDPDQLYPVYYKINTQKSKFLLSQAFKWKKKYVFRNPLDAI